MIRCNSDLAFLTQSTLLMFRDSLFRLPKFFFKPGFVTGRSMIELLLCGSHVTIGMHAHSAHKVMRVSCGFQNFFLEVNINQKDMPRLNAHIVILQRWTRAWLARREQMRAVQLAASMANHLRLGAESPLGSLGCDLVELCVRLVLPRRFVRGCKPALDSRLS